MTKAKASLSFILCHWLLAVSILFLFVSSWWMLSLPLPSDTIGFRVLPFQLHKNIGITLFHTNHNTWLTGTSNQGRED